MTRLLLKPYRTIKSVPIFDISEPNFDSTSDTALHTDSPNVREDYSQRADFAINRDEFPAFQPDLNYLDGPNFHADFSMYRKIYDDRSTPNDRKEIINHNNVKTDDRKAHKASDILNLKDALATRRQFILISAHSTKFSQKNF